MVGRATERKQFAGILVFKCRDKHCHSPCEIQSQVIVSSRICMIYEAVYGTIYLDITYELCIRNGCGSNSAKYYTLTNYLLEINNNSALSWNYSVSNPVTLFHLDHKVNRLVTYVNLTQGQFHFESLINGSVYASTTFSLSANSSSENITFNVTLGNQTFSAQDSGKEVYSNVRITNVNSGNVSIYEIGVNATWSTSANLSLNGIPKQTTNTSNLISHNTNFSLKDYYKYTYGTTLNITIKGDGDFNINTNNIEVLYYITSLSQGGAIKHGK